MQDTTTTINDIKRTIEKAKDLDEIKPDILIFLENLHRSKCMEDTAISKLNKSLQAKT